jgi:hypothetical protein
LVHPPTGAKGPEQQQIHLDLASNARNIRLSGCRRYVAVMGDFGPNRLILGGAISPPKALQRDF